jgi:hypothetical protein
MARKPIVTTWMIAVTLTVTLGCNSVQRRFVVRSTPPGAEVYIDKQFIGRSPVSVPFTYYGTRQIQLEKDGYKTVQIEQNFKPRWYGRFPISLIAENFWPREIRDERVMDFELTPKEVVSDRRLIERADELRGNVHTGTVTLPVPR